MTTVVEYDVVVVGAGAAGMVGALVAAKHGLRTVVVEKAAVYGGSTARSGAGIWVPNNEVILAAGVPDTPDKAAAYLSAVVGDEVPASRLQAYLAAGPATISFVLQHTPLRFAWMEGYSDYYPELPGGLPDGRSIEPQPLDANLLGAEYAALNGPYMATPPGTVVMDVDYKWLALIARHPRGLTTATEIVGRYLAAWVRGQKPITMGQALAGGLRAGLLAADVPVWLNTPLTELHVDGGRVAGVRVVRDGDEMLLMARRGVIVGSGGFEHNEAMRKQYQQEPIGVDWTVGAASNTGDGIQACAQVGAALDLMDSAWWGPMIPLPTGPYFCLSERTLPGNIFVDPAGDRFVNEAAPYGDVVRVMYAQDAFPTWMITDQRYRNRYLFRDIPPLLPYPDEWYRSGVLFRDWTIEGLAGKIGVPPAALRATVNRFNNLAEAGRDTDFHRGDSSYDHYYADPTNRPNPCLAALGLPPFYAMRIVPGDLGTNGGVRTDARGRALRADGSLVPGLYVAGNASAAVMGHGYAGAGSTIGPAMTFGYLAALDIAGSSGG
ncbi:3-oxosteroid 1-dehydrogenase [Micromonospora sp. WMMA1363]|uniref:3-oxosteroid 1-dehydrogenase n=1 Tax=Micromonospora sp. WMMA1363 TaxID=3053985 RepID=UPI00259CB418|nr:3-oxosteroid 1-dehydrogenase [Micromonospora sp. WMMA1363]MDM4719429.1 3-oxosteroid 1-dehydrogenase [Micromonospora sp. WMMA1363]